MFTYSWDFLRSPPAIRNSETPGIRAVRLSKFANFDMLLIIYALLFVATTLRYTLAPRALAVLQLALIVPQLCRVHLIGMEWP